MYYFIGIRSHLYFITSPNYIKLVINIQDQFQLVRYDAGWARGGNGGGDSIGQDGANLAANGIRERAQRILAAVAEPHRSLQRLRCLSIRLGARARPGDERDDDGALSPH